MGNDRKPYVNLEDALLVSDFVDACPLQVCVDPLLPEIDLVAVRKFIEANPTVLKRNVRRVLNQVILDMAIDNVDCEHFVEFGAFVLDRCAEEGVSHFCDRFNDGMYMNFLDTELPKYKVTGSERATRLLRQGLRRVWCSKEGCYKEGAYCCSRCLRKLDVRVFYCSKKCQKEHYPAHRHLCGKTLSRGNLCLLENKEEYTARLESRYWRAEGMRVIKKLTDSLAWTKCETKSMPKPEKKPSPFEPSRKESRVAGQVKAVEPSSRLTRQTLKRGFLK